MRRALSFILTFLLSTSLLAQAQHGKGFKKGRGSATSITTSTLYVSEIYEETSGSGITIQSDAIFNADVIMNQSASEHFRVTADGDTVKIQPYKELYILDIEVDNSRVASIDSSGNITSVATVQGEQLTSTDDATVADILTVNEAIHVTSDGDTIKLQPYKQLYMLDIEVGNTRIFSVDSTGEVHADKIGLGTITNPSKYVDVRASGTSAYGWMETDGAAADAAWYAYNTSGGARASIRAWGSSCGGSFQGITFSDAAHFGVHGATNIFIGDAGTGGSSAMYFGVGSDRPLQFTSGATVFNVLDADTDFEVISDDSTVVLKVDAGTNAITQTTQLVTQSGTGAATVHSIETATAHNSRVDLTTLNSDWSIIASGSDAGFALYNNNATSSTAFAIDANGGVTINGVEGQDGVVYLSADDGDDNADTWRMNVTASANNLKISTYASGAYEDILILEDDAGVVTLAGREGTAGVLQLYADNGDDNADRWQVTNADGGNLSIKSYASGSWAEVFEIDASGGRKLLESLAADGDYEGTITTVTYGETVAFGDLVVLKSDGEYYKTDADAAATMPACLIALEAKNDGESGLALVKGYIREDDWNWTVGDGEANLLCADDGTAGDMVQYANKPSDAGDRVQVVGRVISADVIYFDPDLSIVVI